jgi:hypothetical protein
VYRVHLYHQFKRVANMYFAVLVCQQVCFDTLGERKVASRACVF